MPFWVLQLSLELETREDGERGLGLRGSYNLPIWVPLGLVLWEEPGWFLWQPGAIATGGGDLVRVEGGPPRLCWEY